MQLSVEIAHDQKPFASGLAQERIGHSREPDGRTGTVGFVVEFRGEVTHQQARFVSYQVAPDEEEFARGAGGYLAYLRREELVAFVEQRDVDAAPVGSGAVDEVVVVCQRGCQIAYCPFALHFGESHDIEARVVYRPCDAGKFRPVAFRVPAIAAGRGEIAVVAERTGDGVEQILDVVEGCRYLSVLGRGILLRQESGSRQEKEKEEKAEKKEKATIDKPKEKEAKQQKQFGLHLYQYLLR